MSNSKIQQLEEQLVKYKAKLADKMTRFKGVRHENSLSELRYTEIMVYRNWISELEKEIAKLKQSVPK